MEKSQVISIRLPESMIRDLNLNVSDHLYWKRNAIIQQAVEAYLYAADHSTQKDILRYNHRFSMKHELDFRKIQESDSKPNFEAGV